MRAIASRCVRGNLVGFLSRGGIPPGLVGFLSPSVIGADVALDDARRLGRTGRAGDARAAGAELPREACACPIKGKRIGDRNRGSPD